MRKCGIAIVGAGPYGLSLAAHLAAYGANFRIFGVPMDAWIAHMPGGMFLKSEGFASNLDGPGNGFTLSNFCSESGMPYADRGLPVAVETFSSYGVAFQKRLVPNVENKVVASIKPAADGFVIALADGDEFSTQNIVMATGINQYPNIPSELAGLPKELLTHTADHSDLSGFKDQSVVVVGAGSSAIDAAGILQRHGAKVTMVARAPKLKYHARPSVRSIFDKIRYPATALGPSWKTLFCIYGASAFRILPEDFRVRFVREHLGPEAGWFARADIEGKVTVMTSSDVMSAGTRDGKAELVVRDKTGAQKVIVADHVIAGTGYDVSVDRMSLLDPSIRAAIKRTGKAPMLSLHFESSVPGLYFVGAPAVNTFGPLQRFVYGARFAARKIAPRLASNTRGIASSVSEPYAPSSTFASHAHPPTEAHASAAASRLAD